MHVNRFDFVRGLAVGGGFLFCLFVVVVFCLIVFSSVFFSSVFVVVCCCFLVFFLAFLLHSFECGLIYHNRFREPKPYWRYVVVVVAAAAAAAKVVVAFV